MPTDCSSTRRAALRRTCALATAGLVAGCTSSNSMEPGAPDTTERGSASAGRGDSRWPCPAGTSPTGHYYDVVHESDDAWELTAGPDPVALGASMTVRLANVSEESLDTWGSGAMTTLQFADGDRWIDVSYFDDVAWGDSAMIHAPGEGWEWSFEVDRESIESVGKFAICADLVAGTFRFVYWGILRADTHYAIGTRFEVTSGE